MVSWLPWPALLAMSPRDHSRQAEWGRSWCLLQTPKSAALGNDLLSRPSGRTGVGVSFLD